MSKFIWVRNPTAINGLATTYVSLRGSDTTGDGTAQNPYRSIAKAYTVAPTKTNIMIDDGEWYETRPSGSKGFFWFGNANTHLFRNLSAQSSSNCYYFLKLSRFASAQYCTQDFIKCIIIDFSTNNSHIGLSFDSCLIVNSQLAPSESDKYSSYNNCVVINSKTMGGYYNMNYIGLIPHKKEQKNNIIISTTLSNWTNEASNNNFTNSGIPNYSQKSINNQITGQTLTDYFNYIVANVSANPSAALIEDLLKCDFTAKPGSANIGAGENGSTIGFNEGYPARATNDSSDIFAEANGATVRNIVWNATLNGYSLAHKDKVCAGSTANTITLASDAEATDDYYNDLFIGITAGNGYGEIHRIIDYDGTTKVATIDTNWTTQPDTQSVYSITGSIVSAVKDFGKVIKVKQNFAFCANMTSYTDTNNASYGMWKEFITTPLQNNGVWELRPCCNFRYEYSLNGVNWNSNDELIAGTDTDNKTDSNMYGNASESYVSANARTTMLRYIKYHIEIGFNIGEDE